MGPAEAEAGRRCRLIPVEEMALKDTGGTPALFHKGALDNRASQLPVQQRLVLSILCIDVQLSSKPN